MNEIECLKKAIKGIKDLDGVDCWPCGFSNHEAVVRVIYSFVGKEGYKKLRRILGSNRLSEISEVKNKLYIISGYRCIPLEELFSALDKI